MSWNIIYSMDLHGISLNTLYNQCQSTGPLLLLLRDETDAVFGGFASEFFHPSHGYYGNGDCFLFKKTLNDIKVFKPTGKNDYLIYSDTKCIAFGGG